MSERHLAVAAGTALLALVIAGFFFVGAMSAAGERPASEHRIFLSDRPPAAGGSVVEVQRRVPFAVRPFVPLQRSVAVSVRKAAGYVLLLLGVAAATVFARDQVVAAYRASLGGWRAVARVGLLGALLLVLVASAAFLTFVVLVGSLGPAIGGGVAIGGGGFRVAGGLLQLVLTGVSAGLLIVALVAFVGFSGAAWRLGDALLSVRPLASLGQAAPAAIVAALGATITYLLAQLPVMGPIITFAAVAYGLGSVAAARLDRAPLATSGPAT